MAFQNRYYQDDAIAAVHHHLYNENTHPLVVIPTGGGKTPVISRVITDNIKEIPDIRIGVLSHQQELLTQGYRTLYNHSPLTSMGIYSAGAGKRDTRSQVQFLGIQSVYNKMDQLVGNHSAPFDLLLIDEAHLVPRTAETMYGRFIQEAHKKANWLKVVGLSATPYRTDSGSLLEGDGALFGDICYEIGTGTLINQGYLTPLISKLTDTKLDVTGVGKAGGDFKPKELQEAVDVEEITRLACEEIMDKSAGRKSWLLFCSGVQHSINVANELKSHGVKAVSLTGDTPNGERRRILEDFKNGKITAICNVGVLTTGFDHVGIDLIALLRPTGSTGLYVQMCGRGLRVIYPTGFDVENCTHEERAEAILMGPKPNCLILDFGQNIHRHGPIDDIQLRKKGVREGSPAATANTKTCPNDGCDTVVAVQTRVCPDCGHEWEFNETAKHDSTASTADILSGGKPKQEIKWVEVKSAHYQVWRKPGSKPSLKVTWRSELGEHPKWFFFDGKPQSLYETKKWWEKICPENHSELPTSAEIAIDLLAESSDITSIAVRKNPKKKKYWDVLAMVSDPGHRREAPVYIPSYKDCYHCHAKIPAREFCSCEKRKGEKDETISPIEGSSVQLT